MALLKDSYPKTTMNSTCNNLLNYFYLNVSRKVSKIKEKCSSPPFFATRCHFYTKNSKNQVQKAVVSDPLGTNFYRPEI